MSNKVTVVEVGPRDGFQSVKEFIPTELKIEIIDRLVASGVKKIQATSFVSPKAIAQMQDAKTIVETIKDKYEGVNLFALVPNYRGAQGAVQAGLREISPVISLSVSHNKANVNRTHEESLAELARIRQDFPDVKITLDIATAFGCPFEGRMEIAPLVDFVGKIYDQGIRSMTLCDTIGLAFPKQVEDTLDAVKSAFPDVAFGLHIHDTRNMGILNSYVGILHGASSVQAAIGGLGGCPFAPGASGNTATEDLVYMLNMNGYDTGIDFAKLVETACYLKEKIQGNYSSHHINIASQQCLFN